MIFPVHLRFSLRCSWNDLICLQTFQSWPCKVSQSWLAQDALSFWWYVDRSSEGIFQSWLLEDTSEVLPFKVLKHPTSGDISDCLPRDDIPCPFAIYPTLQLKWFELFANLSKLTLRGLSKLTCTGRSKLLVVCGPSKFNVLLWAPHRSSAKKSRRAVERRNLSKLTFGRHFRIFTIQSPQTSNFRRHLRLST